jgi:hypothetical protein
MLDRIISFLLGNKREAVAGFEAKSEQLATTMSGTTIRCLKNCSRGDLQRSAVVN